MYVFLSSFLQNYKTKWQTSVRDWTLKFRLNDAARRRCALLSGFFQRARGWTESRNFLYSNAERDARHRVGFHSRSTIVLGRGSAAMCRTDRPEASAFISRLFSSATGQPARVDSDSGGWLLECTTRLLYLLAYIIIRAFADTYLASLPLTRRASFSLSERETSAIVRLCKNSTWL